jgi:hypothetical protein
MSEADSFAMPTGIMAWSRTGPQDRIAHPQESPTLHQSGEDLEDQHPLAWGAGRLHDHNRDAEELERISRIRHYRKSRISCARAWQRRRGTLLFGGSSADAPARSFRGPR